MIKRFSTSPAELSKTMTAEDSFFIQDIQLVDDGTGLISIGPSLNVTYVFRNSVRTITFEITTPEKAKIFGRSEANIFESIREQIRDDIKAKKIQSNMMNIVTELRKKYLGKTIKLNEEEDGMEHYHLTFSCAKGDEEQLKKMNRLLEQAKDMGFKMTSWTYSG